MPREPGSAASGARMAQRSRRAESGGHDARSERPATGHGLPRASVIPARRPFQSPAVNSTFVKFPSQPSSSNSDSIVSIGAAT